jgi:hypothetical protein
MIGHDLVETARHDHGDRYAIALDAFTQDLLELGIGVVADSGFLVLRDIGRRHFERRLVPAPTAGKCAPGNIGVAARALWRMAVAASENAIDQIIAALDQISVCPRNVECGDKREDQCSCCPEQSGPPHPSPRVYMRAAGRQFSPSRNRLHESPQLLRRDPGELDRFAHVLEIGANEFGESFRGQLLG